MQSFSSFCCSLSNVLNFFFFFNDTATTEIYTLSYTTLFRSQVVLPGSERKSDRRLSGLLGTVNKNVGAGRMARNEQPLCVGFQFDPLVQDSPGGNQNRSLHGLVSQIGR